MDRHELIKQLWESYQRSLNGIPDLMTSLNTLGIHSIPLDHLAIIDLPSKHSGIPTLLKLFSALGYEYRGCGYLADKQNDFVWMAESQADFKPVTEVLPQVVIADFRLDELPTHVKTIIEKYTRDIPPFSLDELSIQYFTDRPWPLPTVSDFRAVHEVNELLAWVLVFGRQPSHFGLSIHLMNSFVTPVIASPRFSRARQSRKSNYFNQLEDFLQLIQEPLNRVGGVIKGTPEGGIIQSSTLGQPVSVELADGVVTLPERFIEFVWRYPKSEINQPQQWGDYFTGFIAPQANVVIESVYAKMPNSK